VAEPTLRRVTAAVTGVLEEARERGFLGPGPVAAHVEHAWPLVAVLPVTGTVVDLGSGGGVPALALAVARPDLEWVLVEAQHRRARGLIEAVAALGLSERVVVLVERAEETGRGRYRGGAAAVVARSFGPPAVTAECAAPLLAAAATCWVAEPPSPDPERWPEDGLGELGLTRRLERAGGWVGLDRVAPCPDRYPRRVGIPAKRPLFGV
jgi:16S rRNA (guanine527-N7)-methyltransferase